MTMGYRALFAVFTTVFTYLILSLFIGSYGIAEYSQLLHYRDALQSNLTELQDVNRSLSGTVDRLQSDAEQIALSARSLGYFKSDEGLIRISGYTAPRKPVSPGKILERVTGKPADPTFIRTLSLAAGLVVFLLLTILSRNQSTSVRRGAPRREQELRAG